MVDSMDQDAISLDDDSLSMDTTTVDPLRRPLLVGVGHNTFRVAPGWMQWLHRRPQQRHDDLCCGDQGLVRYRFGVAERFGPVLEGARGKSNVFIDMNSC